MVDKTQYLNIRRQVQARLDFYSHVRIYLFGCLVLLTLGVVTPGGWWFAWPIVGWGIGVVVHSARVGLGRW